MVDVDWPFDQPRNCAVVTLQSIIFGGDAILYVVHDDDDDGWQFLDGRAFVMANAALVSLEEIVRHDPSVLKLADMPPGWSATRKNKDAPGIVSKTINPNINLTPARQLQPVFVGPLVGRDLTEALSWQSKTCGRMT